MPERFAEYWWEEMPPKATKAAKALGYDKEKWDNDYEVPYDTKTFQQATTGEKHAAMFLGMNPINKKLDVWWEDLDKKTKDAAEVLGWTKEKWDDDWGITDLPCEEWNWDDMNKKQKNAATHFGYSKATWDETFEEEDFNTKSKFSSPPPKKQSKQSAQSAQKPTKQEEEEEEDEEKSSGVWGVIDKTCSYTPCCAIPYRSGKAVVTACAK